MLLLKPLGCEGTSLMDVASAEGCLRRRYASLEIHFGCFTWLVCHFTTSTSAMTVLFRCMISSFVTHVSIERCDQ